MKTTLLTTELSNKKPWYKQFWPWVLIFLPLSVVVASFVTLAIILEHPDAEVKDAPAPHGLIPLDRTHSSQ